MSSNTVELSRVGIAADEQLTSMFRGHPLSASEVSPTANGGGFDQAADDDVLRGLYLEAVAYSLPYIDGSIEVNVARRKVHEAVDLEEPAQLEQTAFTLQDTVKLSNDVPIRLNGETWIDPDVESLARPGLDRSAGHISAVLSLGWFMEGRDVCPLRDADIRHAIVVTESFRTVGSILGPRFGGGIEAFNPFEPSVLAVHRGD